MTRAWVLIVAFLALPALAETVRLETKRVPIAGETEGPIVQGALEHRSTLELKSTDRRFGGFSALWVDPRGERILAVSDEGAVFEAQLIFDENGALQSLDQTALSPLCGESGNPIQGKIADAEGLARLADGSWLVSFEQRHRIARYRALGRDRCARAEPFPPPPGLERVRIGEGLETLAALGGFRLLAIAESESGEAPGLHRAWIFDGATWQMRGYEGGSGFLPTDAARLADGDVLVVERHFVPLLGVSIRLKRLAAATLETPAPAGPLRGSVIAVLTPPVPIDNIEGLAVFERAGDVHLLMVSDDNFSPLQRVLLMHWVLRPNGAAR
jgi:hypothetical protein